MDQAFKAARCAQVNQHFHISDWIKKTLSSRTVRDGGSATFIPGGPMQLEPQLQEELPGNVARMNQKKFNR
jgi:hypothetical protein